MIPALLASTLCALGLLHVYWALGGGRGQGVSVPEVAGRPAFRPSRTATFGVGLGLFGAAGIALVRGGLLGPALPGSPAHWAAIALGLVFVARAVGEFRLVGFLKRVRGTPFARLDSWLYSPLSLLLGLGFLWIATLP